MYTGVQRKDPSNLAQKFLNRGPLGEYPDHGCQHAQETSPTSSRRNPTRGIPRSARPFARRVGEGDGRAAHAGRAHRGGVERHHGRHRATPEQGARHVGVALAQSAEPLRCRNGGTGDRPRTRQDRARDERCRGLSRVHIRSSAPTSRSCSARRRSSCRRNRRPARAPRPCRRSPPAPGRSVRGPASSPNRRASPSSRSSARGAEGWR